MPRVVGHVLLALTAGALLLGCELLPLPRFPAPDDSPPGGSSGTGQTLELPGLVHRATRARPVRRVALDVPPGTYRRVVLEVTVTHGGWSERRPSGTHNLFWLARDRNRDLLGYANLRGRNRIFLRHGLGQRQPAKARRERGFRWPPGATYRLRYVYDTAARRIRLEVLDGGRKLTSLEHVPNVAALTFGARQRLVVDLGFTGTDNPNEPASIGWSWSDLLLEIR